MDDPRRSANQAQHQFRQFDHSELHRIADVHWTGEAALSVHHAQHRLDQVVDVAEAARLAAITVDGDVFAAQCLHDEVAHHATIVGVHARPVGVENAHHLDIQL